MAHFTGYSTESVNAAKEGWIPLPASGEENHELVQGPFQTDRAQKIVGSVFADQAGELLVQQSFDGENWDIQDKIAVSASTGTKIEVTIIAPVWRLKFVNTTNTKQKKFRLYARSYESGN